MKPKFKIFSGYESIIPDFGKFPGGEIRVRVNEQLPEQVHIEAILLNSDDIMTLVMLVDAVRELGVRKIRLTMPYIPYARQDRVCNSGEAFSIRAFANIINSLKFSSVLVYDAHSEVSTKLINRCLNQASEELIRENKEAYEYICRGGWSEKPLYLISPDKGSILKSQKIAETFPQFNGVVYAEKVRNPENGQITRTDITNVPDDFVGANMMICDDICDGGRTFIELAKVLQEYEPSSLALYVTHGIFSKGEEVLREAGITDVFSTVRFSEYQ